MGPLLVLWRSRTVIGALVVAVGNVVKLYKPETGAVIEGVGVVIAGIGIRSAIAKHGVQSPLAGHVPGAPTIGDGKSF